MSDTLGRVGKNGQGANAQEVQLGQPDWGENSHSLAFNLANPRYGTQIHIMINAFWEPLTFELPPLPQHMHPRWFRLIDTWLPTPEDIVEPGKAPEVKAFEYQVQPRSVVILLALSQDLSRELFRDSRLILDYETPPPQRPKRTSP